MRVKTEHDKTHGTDRRRKQTNITSETMMKRRKSRKNRFDKNQSINRGSHTHTETEAWIWIGDSDEKGLLQPLPIPFIYFVCDHISGFAGPE